MTDLSLDELHAIRDSLKLGRRDNFTPILAASALLLTGIAHHHGTDVA